MLAVIQMKYKVAQFMPEYLLRHAAPQEARLVNPYYICFVVERTSATMGGEDEMSDYVA